MTTNHTVNHTMPLTLGQKIRLLRQTAERSEPETCLLLQIPYYTYLRYEAGILYPTENALRKIAKLYTISHAELLNYSQKQTKNNSK